MSARPLGKGRVKAWSDKTTSVTTAIVTFNRRVRRQFILISAGNNCLDKKQGHHLKSFLLKILTFRKTERCESDLKGSTRWEAQTFSGMRRAHNDKL